jgi:hypothetical protein
MTERIPKEHIEKHIERTLKHIALVNKYGARLGRRYPDHDADKLDPNALLVPYTYVTMQKMLHIELTGEEKESMDRATFLHIRSNQHHPEFWTNSTTLLLARFGRDNEGFNNPIRDASNMPEYALD